MTDYLNMLIPFLLILPWGIIAIYLTPPPPAGYLADDDPDAPIVIPARR